MFKKENHGQGQSSTTGGAQSPAGSKQPAARRSGGHATIGPSIVVKGDISGDEDLVVQGRVEGSVNLSQHNVTIGGNGRVKADVNGRTVVVEGEVKGDLRAQEQIILRHTAKVEGSIAAPRVALEDGAEFRGSIEMDSKSSGATPKAAEPAKAQHGSRGGSEKDQMPSKGPGPKATV